MRSTTLELALLSVLCASLVYVVVDMYTGSSGIASRSDLRTETRQVQADINAAKAREAILTDKVTRLSGDRIDTDLLDEKLRATFGVVREDELLLIEPGR